MKTFATTIIVAFSMVYTFSGCNNKKEEERWKHERDSLKIAMSERDTVISSFLTSFNEIESNLDSINNRQAAIIDISTGNGEIKRSSKERINENIALINKSMEENRKKIEEINKRLQNSMSTISGMEGTLTFLRKQLYKKDKELIVMNVRLSKMSDSITTLETSVDLLGAIGQMQAQYISNQRQELQKVFYVTGKKKELQDKKVITPEGGILSLGQLQKLCNELHILLTAIHLLKMKKVM